MFATTGVPQISVLSLSPSDECQRPNCGRVRHPQILTRCCAPRRCPIFISRELQVGMMNITPPCIPDRSLLGRTNLSQSGNGFQQVNLLEAISAPTEILHFHLPVELHKINLKFYFSSTFQPKKNLTYWKRCRVNRNYLINIMCCPKQNVTRNASCKVQGNIAKSNI